VWTALENRREPPPFLCNDHESLRTKRFSFIPPPTQILLLSLPLIGKQRKNKLVGVGDQRSIELA
jgi:hypothetical protein